MAKLYKMTLYVCDLEEDLDLEQIKELIDNRGLDGVSISCITHYAGEQEGPYIEWYDDIDLNYRNSTTEQWEKYFDKKVNSNGFEKEIEELKKRVEFLERQNRERLSNEIAKLKSEASLIDFNKKLNERLNKLSNEREEKIKWNG